MDSKMKEAAFGINQCSLVPSVAKDNKEPCLTSMFLEYKEKKETYDSQKMCASMCMLSGNCVMWKYTKMETPKDNCVFTKFKSMPKTDDKVGYYKYCKAPKKGPKA